MGRNDDEMADVIGSIMDNADVDAFLSLCADDVHWGPPGDARSGCHNRNQVRSWYESAFRRGVRASVAEVVQGPTGLLVGLRVSGRGASEEDSAPAERWQVMTIRDGLIRDICGFDDRAEAVAWAGITS